MVMSYQALNLVIQILLLWSLAPKAPLKESRVDELVRYLAAHRLCFSFRNFLQFKFYAY